MVLLHTAMVLMAQTVPPPNIRTTVPLVLTPVTVTGKDSTPVHDMTAEEFQVYDGNVLRPHQIEITRQPISIVFLVQTSRAAGAALAKVPKIASMILPLIAGEGGQAALISFSNRIEVRQPLTPNADALGQAFRALRPDGDGSRMLDGVATALRLLDGTRETRKVLILVGESKDRDSETKLTEVVEMAIRSNVTIYPLNFSPTLTAFTSKGREHFGDEKDREREPAVYQPGTGFSLIAGLVELSRLGKENSSEVLAKSTGGVRQSFLRLSGLEELVKLVGEDLHTQYLITFQPVSATEPAYREIRVIANRSGVAVRARPGYWAQP